MREKKSHEQVKRSDTMKQETAGEETQMESIKMGIYKSTVLGEEKKKKKVAMSCDETKVMDCLAGGLK